MCPVKNNSNYLLGVFHDCPAGLGYIELTKHGEKYIRGNNKLVIKMKKWSFKIYMRCGYIYSAWQKDIYA